MDNNQTIQWHLIFSGIKEATQDIQRLRDEIDKIKQQKLTGGISDQLQQEMSKASSLMNEKGKEINGILNGIGSNTTGINKFVDGYRQAIASATADAEKFHRLFSQTGDVQYQSKSIEAAAQVRTLTAEYEKFNNVMGLGAKQASLFGTTLENMKHHAQWLVSGGLLMGAIAIPGEAVKTIADVEQQMAGMLQTLPQLYKDYPNHIKDQEALNKLTKDFIGIGQQYGQEVDKVIEAGKLWSRGYKDVNTVLALTHKTSQLSIADLMDLTAANTGVESVISAYHRQGDAVNFASHVVDSYTNIAHNAQTSATDLSESMKRSAAAANQVGVSFDFASAMAATLIKDSGQAGGIVGNTLKAIFSNVHSKKGIEELEKLGISIYEFDQNGTKHFRNVESVFTELMIKMRGSSVNMEETMKKISGGTFQWSRASALFSDYNEFIKNYNLSINSSGVAEKQVMAQMDTLIRKGEQVKAAFTGVIMGSSDAGLANYLKSWLDSILNVLKGLQQIPTGVYSTMGTMARWGVIIYAAKTALDFLNRSVIACTTAKAAMTTASAAQTVAEGSATVATNAETAAMTRLGVASTAATGGLNLLLAGLIMAGAGATLYASNVGEATTAMENQQQKQQDLLAVKQEELDMNAKQTEFIGTLANSYVQLQEKLNTTGEATKEGIEIKKSMSTTTEELTKLIGEEGIARLQQSNWSQEAIKAEQNTHSQASNSIRSEIAGIKRDMDDFTDRQIAATEARINSLYKETEALSIWRRAQLAAYDLMAGFQQKVIDAKTVMFNNMPDFMMGEKTQLGASIDNDRAYLANFSEHSRDSLRDDIAAAKAELAQLKLSKFKRDSSYGNSSADNGNDNNYGGTEVDTEAPKTKKGRTKADPIQHEAPDKTDEIEKLWANRTVNSMLAESKVKATEYTEALEKLNTKQEVFGITSETSAAKLKLMNDRIQAIITENTGMEALRQQYEQQANDMVAASTEAINALNEKKTSWASLSKQEQADFVHAYGNYLQDEKLLLRLLDLADKLKVKIADNKKEASGLGNNVLKEQKDDPGQIYSRDIQNLNLDKEHSIYQLGRNATTKQKNEVDLQYSILELAAAQQRLKEIENSPSHKEEELKVQQVAVDKLKQHVEELSDVWATQREQAFDVLDAILIKGNSWKDELKNIWKQLGSEALHLLITGKASSGGGGLLGGILNLFGHADGGIFDEEHVARFAEGNKAEAVIPLEDNKERGKQIWYESGKRLGTLNDLQPKNTDSLNNFAAARLGFKPEKVEYVATLKNPNLVKQFAAMNSQTQQNNDHIAELKEANELMKQQNQMLMHMINNGKGGGSNVAIINGNDPQAMSDFLQSNQGMQVMQNVLGKMQSLNYRWR